MAWIESHQELRDNPKTRKLARILNVSIPTTVGHLQCLWWWATDYAQDGNLSKYDNEDIADAMMWEGKPEELIKALIKSRFIDEDENGRQIHDWWEYAGKLVERREKDRERKRNTGSIRSNSKPVSDISTGNPLEVSQTDDGAHMDSIVTEQYSTEQNNTEPYNNTPPNPRKRRKRQSADVPLKIKTMFAEFVSMTNEEYASLVTKLGEQGAKRCVEILDNYKGASGKKYDSDYRAILNWVVKRYEEEQGKALGARGSHSYDLNAYEALAVNVPKTAGETKPVPSGQEDIPSNGWESFDQLAVNRPFEPQRNEDGGT